jgi:hypothetical protein
MRDLRATGAKPKETAATLVTLADGALQRR